MSERVWRFCVEVPIRAGEDVCDRIYAAICDAVDKAEPAERDGWDSFIYGLQADVMDDDETEAYAHELGLS